MGESMSSLYRRGAISSKQMGRMAKPAILSKTTAQPSKMAKFQDKGGKRDQGGVRDHGEVPGNEIEHPTNQDKGGTFGIGGRRGPPSSGGRAGAEKNPAKGAQIDAADAQKPRFPARGSSVSSKEASRKVGVTGPKGKSAKSQYGGPASRKYG